MNEPTEKPCPHTFSGVRRNCATCLSLDLDEANRTIRGFRSATRPKEESDEWRQVLSWDDLRCANDRLREQLAALEAFTERGWSSTFAEYDDGRREFVVWETCLEIVEGGLGRPLGSGPTLVDAAIAAVKAVREGDSK